MKSDYRIGFFLQEFNSHFHSWKYFMNSVINLKSRENSIEGLGSYAHL
jgi:hypothetical protein